MPVIRQYQAINYGFGVNCEREVANDVGVYDHQVVRNVHTALDNQCVTSLAFNRDRAPVRIFGVWVHYKF